MPAPKCKPLPPLNQSDIDRFWPKVDRSGGPDACWPWLAAKSDAGYGYFGINRRNWQPHRIAYFLATGEDPYPLLVCHSCDNPPCCNPTHLFKGTYADNNHDMLAKGHQARGDRHGRHTHPERNAAGERNGGARLKREQVEELRRLAAEGETVQALATRFGVACGHVGSILRRRFWAHV